MRKSYKQDKLLRIPVTLVNGKWVTPIGKEAPVQEGCGAMLELAVGAIRDIDFLAQATKKIVVQVLPPGESVMVALNGISAGVHGGGKFPNVPAEFSPFADPYFVPVVINYPVSDAESAAEPEFSEGGLWLKMEGWGRSVLKCGSVRLPEDIDPNPFQSLNHACTRLSEIFEPDRISHTGNVYSRVFYRETNGAW